MRAHLLERLSGAASVVMLDPDPWFRAVGRAAHSPKLWYASKVPYTQALFSEAAADVLAVLRGSLGESRRVLVVDLDETLWGGVVGETGARGIELGGHNHRGEAFVDFQHALKALTRRGIQLAIASKNEQSVAMEAISQHPEMVLRPGDFAAWRINWSDKATSLREIASELNLGLGSFVFIDDNAAERARVRETLPDVFVPEWPADPTLYVQALWELRCFDTTALSAEDESRGEMYRAERLRREAATATHSQDEWLATLGVTVKASRLTATDLPRAAQLFNKTNQMSLSTRRLSEREIDTWSRASDTELWTFRVSDRFGDYGLTALLGLQFGDTGAEATIVDWLLSCRVMGRCVEESLLYLAVKRARLRGSRVVNARLLETERNAPTVSFWRTSGFEEVSALTFCWDASQAFERPEPVLLSGNMDD
jgi:FkbH-like protein